jgi:D-inositol-3-phosphate glycosyltransferase
VVADPELRERLAQGAIAQAREFSWEATAEKTLEVYRQARSFMREPA